jgi:hypothetical protein
VLHLEHEPSRQWFQIRIVDSILGGDDEAELMSVAVASVEEAPSFSAFLLGVIESSWFSVSRESITLQVSKVSLCAT